MTENASATIRHEAERFSAALLGTDPEQRVPTCPEWTAEDLLWHLTEVHEFWAQILATGASTEQEVRAIDEAKAPRPEGRQALAERRAAATQALIHQLDARADDDPAWFWYSALQGVGITRRMQTHEVTIHRVDAELAAGLPVSGIDPRTAADGLAHVLEVMWPAAFEWIPDWARISPVAVIEIRTRGGSPYRLGISRWSGTRPRDGAEFDEPVGRLLDGSEETADLPRAHVTGSALALDLWAWGRRAALEHLANGAQDVEIGGDPAAISQLEALIAAGHD